MANPMKLVSRIKKVQEDLLILKEQCRELLTAKQDLIDKARITLVGNRTLLQQMQASVGIPLISNSDDPALYLGELHLRKIMESLTVEISYSPTNGGNELNLIERDRNLNAGAYDL